MDEVTPPLDRKQTINQKEHTMKAKVLRNYKRKSDGDLGEFAQNVHDGIVANGSFPTGGITAVGFQTDITSFITTAAHAVKGSDTDRANRDNARAALTVDLDALADWTDLTADGDVSIITAFGFEPTATTRSTSVLAVPRINSVINYANTKLKLLVGNVPKAHGFEVQVSSGTGPWVLQASFPSTRNMILENLVPGTLYNIRVRALGGSTGYSEWSSVATCMCT
jgi:hypothetical protein